MPLIRERMRLIRERMRLIRERMEHKRVGTGHGTQQKVTLKNDAFP